MTYFKHALPRPRPVDHNMDPLQVQTQLIWHTAVSNAHDPGPSFPPPGSPNYGVDWHCYLDEDGSLYQYRDLEVNADANDDANVRSLSIETWDGGDPESNEWTPKQIAAMKVTMIEAHNELGIPYVQCPTWNAPGFGYHRLFPEWDHPAHYHSCPGNLRVAQWNREIIPWLEQMAAGNAAPTHEDNEEEDEVASAAQDAAAVAEREKYIAETVVILYESVRPGSELAEQGPAYWTAEIIEGKSTISNLARQLAAAK